MSIARRRRHFAVISLAVSLAACGGDSGGGGGTTTPPIDNSVSRIDVSPSTALSLTSGATTTLVAAAFTKSNTALGSSGVSWASSNDAVAAVVGGVVTAKLAGTATITALSGSVSSAGVSVTVTPGAAAQLALRVQPDGASSAAPFSTQPVVEVRDAAGNVVPSSALVVTAALASGGGALTGTATATSVAGVATFSGLTVTGLVGPRALTFTATGVSAATSASFSLAPGIASALAIRTQPVAGTAYAAFTTPAVVEIRDGAGNVTNSTATVTATIASGGGALGGTASLPAVAGVATFSTLTVNGTSGARTLTFSSGALSTVSSVSFTVAAAPPAVIAVAASSALAAALASNPAPVNLPITNSGVFPLTNLRIQGITYSPVSPAGWLTATFSSGTDAPATLRLTATSASLPTGTYTATVVVAGDGAAATASITVTLTVAPQLVNTYGTTANKVSILNVGSTLSPGLVTTTTTGTTVTTDPTVTYASQSKAIATVDATGKITGVAPGEAWVVASSTQAGADSVLVIVPRTSGVIVRTDLTKYRYKIGDTVTVHIQIDTRGTALGAATVTFTWPVWVGPVGTFGTLTFIDINGSASPMAPQTTVDRSLNVIRINGASVAGATGVVELAIVRFKVTAAGTNMFYVDAVELLGPDFSNLLPAATVTHYPVIAP